MRKLVILLHRYLGIALALLFVIWFASGFAIIYTGGMPELTENARLISLPGLDLERVSVSPNQAQQLARASSIPKLTTIMNRPAYRFSESGGSVVFADDGTVLSGAMISSRQIIADFTGAKEEVIERIGRIEEVDQWTIPLRSELPLEKFRVNDGSGTEVYVSPRWGQVLLVTDSRDRFLAWIGAIPHWLYFVDLRRNTALWTEVVVWLSSLGTILVSLGIVLIFIQLRRTRPFSFSGAIPYKGIMRWHFLTGLFFGLITLTWVFSGLLSMDPYPWTRARGLAFDQSIMHGGEVNLERFDTISLQLTGQELSGIVNSSQIKEIEFKRIQGEYFFYLTIPSSESSWGFTKTLVNLNNLQAKNDLFSTSFILQQLAQNLKHEILASEVLQEYDNYYYSRPSSNSPSAPLPVLRIDFDDADRSSIYVNLNTGELAGQTNRMRRIERWLYNGFHSLDFQFWYGSRPLWDIGIILLLSGGLLLALIGAYIGIKRLFRNTRALIS